MTNSNLRNWLIAIGSFCAGFAACALILLIVAGIQPKDVYEQVLPTREAVEATEARTKALIDHFGIDDPADNRE